MKKEISDKKTYKMRIKTLSPVFVGGGTGSVLNRTGYIFDEKKQKVYILDEGKWMDLLSKRGWTDEYARYISQNSGDNKGGRAQAHRPQTGQTKKRSGNNSNRNNIHLADWLQAKRITNYEKIACYAIPTLDVDKGQINDLHCFIRDGQGFPYVPGSSIKGALRTVLLKEILRSDVDNKLWNMWEENLRQLKNAVQNKDKDGRKKWEERLRSTGQKAEQNHFYKIRFSDEIETDDSRPKDYSALRDIFRGISISDSLPINHEQLYITRQVRLSTYNKNGYRKTLPLYAEYLQPGTEIVFTISLNEAFLKYGEMSTMETILKFLDSYAERLPDLLNDNVFSALGDYYWSIDEWQQPNFTLGGGVGFAPKVVLPELAPDSSALLSTSKSYLEYKFSRHRHQVLDHKAAPRTMKLAAYDGRDYVVGMCRLEVAEQ